MKLQQIKVSSNEKNKQFLDDSQKQIKIKMTNSARLGRQKMEKQGSELEMEVMSQSRSNTNLKHKLPQVILQYIMQKARQNNPGAGASQMMKKSKAGAMINKLGLSKKLKQKYDKKNNVKFVSMSQCEHKYCGSCLHQYVIYKINAFESVQCPDQNCRKQLDQTTQFYSQLPLDARKKYKKHLQYDMIKDFPNRRMCPSESCQGWIQIEDNITPICNKCRHKFCPKCLFQQHQGDCDPHQLNFFQDTLHYRQCSKCKRVIQKSSGCNHITCFCKYQFCYVCGKKWSHSHLCNNPQNQPVFVQPIDCCCCEVRCDCYGQDCCQCCDNCQCCQCCQTCLTCFGDCCQSCCDVIGTCCQACCTCDCQCCDGFCRCCCECKCCQCCQCCFTQVLCSVWVVFLAYSIKFLLVLIWATMVLPLYGMIFLFIFILWILLVPFVGMTVYFCEFIMQLQGCFFVLALIFFPISMIISTGRAYKQSYDQFMSQFTKQTFSIPAEMMTGICQISFQN